MVAEASVTAKQLITERDAIDSQIEAYLDVLKENNATMDSALVDGEGYPIANVDHYAVREARHKIICLRNDRTALMNRIDEALKEVHAGASKEQPQPATKTVHRTSNTPFAKVSNVKDGSPAQQDGFLEGDLLLQYDILHHGNFKELKELSEITQQHKDQVIRVTVIRADRPVRLELRPRQWNGAGLLGCGIVPMTTSQIV